MLSGMRTESEERHVRVSTFLPFPPPDGIQPFDNCPNSELFFLKSSADIKDINAFAMLNLTPFLLQAFTFLINASTLANASIVQSSSAIDILECLSSHNVPFESSTSSNWQVAPFFHSI